MNKPRRQALLRGAVITVGASLLALAIPAGSAAADPVPPTNGEIIGTPGIGFFDPTGDPQRINCPGTQSLTALRVYRVANEAPEPITGLRGICSDVFADTGVVNLVDPQPHLLIGFAAGETRDSQCPPGAVVTGLRGRTGEIDPGAGTQLVGIQALCSHLNADGSLTPAPDAPPALFDPVPADPQIGCLPDGLTGRDTGCEALRLAPARVGSGRRAASGRGTWRCSSVTPVRPRTKMVSGSVVAAGRSWV